MMMILLHAHSSACDKFTVVSIDSYTFIKTSVYQCLL